MKQTRAKGQALALVLIVIAVSVIIAYGITSRVIEDIQQQGEERASTRAESFSESAVESVAQKIQKGETIQDQYYLDSRDVDSLDICDNNSADLEKRCDPKSTVEVQTIPQIIQFKLFSSESIEVHMTDPMAATLSNAAAVKSSIMIHLKSNSSFPDILNQADSAIMLKSFYYTDNKTQVNTECVININPDAAGLYGCSPTKKGGSQIISVAKIACPKINVSTLTDTARLGDQGNYCFTVTTTQPTAFYRVKPLLPGASDENGTPFIDISVTGVSNSNSYELPIDQMAIINAGVYTGTEGTDQQVFQQATKFMLIHKAVPEMADYVLYNGSNQPLTKNLQ